jgi:hypothetical protein
VEKEKILHLINVVLLLKYVCHFISARVTFLEQSHQLSSLDEELSRNFLEKELFVEANKMPKRVFNLIPLRRKFILIVRSFYLLLTLVFA